MADEIDLIRTRINILDLVGQRTALKKAGRSYKALCPFHDDRNPSMTVNPELGRYKCWSCGASGDIFNWVMETQKVDFAEALKILAAQAGVELKAGRREPGQSMKATHEAMMKAAHEFFIKQLELSQTAKAYCTQRGLEPEVLEAWGIGFGPEEGSALAVTLRRQGFSLSEAQSLFLVDQDGSGGFYDRFRGRLIIPIQDERGRVVAFGGRIIGSGQPKYINSSDTPLYHKSDLLFGLHRAKEFMSKRERAVLVEGYMDVIACHRAGMTEAVASLGTALTEQQVRLLKRWTSQVVVLYDRDEAGQKAAEKACEMLAAEGVIARVALPPPGEDPDSLLVKKGAAGVLALLDEAVSPIRFKLMRLDEKKKPTDPGYWDEVVDILATSTNIVDLDAQVTLLADKMVDQPNKATAMNLLRGMVLSHPNCKVPRTFRPLRADLKWEPNRLELALTPAQRGLEGTVLRALMKPELTSVAWHLLREPGLLRPGTPEIVAKEIIATFSDSPPPGPMGTWIHQLSDPRVIDLLAELCTLQATDHHLKQRDALSAVTPEVLEAAVLKLRRLKVTRMMENAKTKGAFSSDDADLDQKLALYRDQLKRNAGVNPDEEP